MRRASSRLAILLATFLIAATFQGCQQEAQEDRIQLGAIMALTGEVASYGIRVRDGMELAVDQINEEVGSNGQPIEIIYEDNQGDPTRAVTAFEKLAQVDRVPMVLGPMLSTESLATAPVAERTKVVQLSTLPGTIELRDAGDYVFRLFPSDEFQGKFLAEQARDVFGAERAAIIYLDNAYGRGIRQVVLNEFTAAGGVIIADEAVAESEINFTSQVTRLRRSDPDLIFGLMYYNEGAQFLVQADQQGLRVPVLGGDAWFGPISDIAGESLRLLVFSSVAFGPAFAKEAAMAEFIRNFESRYGEKPDSYNATGYDAVFVAKRAFEMAESRGITVKEALYATELSGALGHIDFDENGDNVGAEFALFTLSEEGARPMVRNESLNRGEALP